MTSNNSEKDTEDVKNVDNNFSDYMSKNKFLANPSTKNIILGPLY